MTNQDPLKKLVDMVNDQLRSGKSKDEIVETLQNAGLESNKAIQLVATVKKSRADHFKSIAKYMVITVASVVAVTALLFLISGAEYFIERTRLLSLIALLPFIVFSFTASIGGKNAVYVRLVNSTIWLVALALLATTMYLHPGWESSWVGTGGGWRGQLITLLGNILYNIGSKGVSYFLAFVFLIVLLFQWAEAHRLKTEDYEPI